MKPHEEEFDSRPLDLSRSSAEWKGTKIPYIDHPELKRPGRMAQLAAEAEKRMCSAPGVLQSEDEECLFKGYQACNRAIATVKNAGVRRYRELRSSLEAHLTEKNLGLIHAMRHRVNTLSVDDDELLSEGHWILLRAIRRFDPWRGARFSTYACVSLLRSYMAMVRRNQRERTQQARYTTQQRYEMELDHGDPVSSDQHGVLHRLEPLMDPADTLLTARERLIIQTRIMTDGAEKPITLQGLGQLLHLSKERVRRIQLQALDKLRHALLQDDEPGAKESPRWTKPDATGLWAA